MGIITLTTLFQVIANAGSGNPYVKIGAPGFITKIFGIFNGDGGLWYTDGFGNLTANQLNSINGMTAEGSAFIVGAGGKITADGGLLVTNGSGQETLGSNSTQGILLVNGPSAVGGNVKIQENGGNTAILAVSGNVLFIEHGNAIVLQVPGGTAMLTINGSSVTLNNGSFQFFDANHLIQINGGNLLYLAPNGQSHEFSIQGVGIRGSFNATGLSMNSDIYMNGHTIHP